MRKTISALLGGRLLNILIASFTLVAVLTVGLNTLVISRVIQNYLAGAQAERVTRDMDLAEGFYQLKLDEVVELGQRIANDPQVVNGVAADGDSAEVLEQVLVQKLTVSRLGGTHIALVLDPQASLLAGRVLQADGSLLPPAQTGDWSELPIVSDTLADGQARSGTEVIPSGLLDQIGLAGQADLSLVETPNSAVGLYDPREGIAGLALVNVTPIYSQAGDLLGTALTAHLFNNDFSLVDTIQDVARIDTATIFFGDLRVSTNVLNADGSRAVGTRVSQDVFQQVLEQGQDYVGRAFVVNDWYITRYKPLHDQRGQIVGMLYVGARETAFQQLVYAFNRQAILIALVCLVLAAVIAIPIARLIAGPISDLVEANRRLAKGDMHVSVQPSGEGELALLGQSFNTMVDTLRNTQRQLLHQEKLASTGQLAAGVAHELNNPLGTILLYSDLVYKSMSEDDPRRADLKMIIDETYRCKMIVSDLLNFARQNEVMAQDMDVNALLDQAIEKVREQPSFEKIEIMRRYETGLPVIQADSAQFLQVFINLLGNAADAFEKDQPGIITVFSRSVGPNKVEIEVSDNGCGIDDENLKKLFTPFFTTKPAGKGTGLGLSIVYGIVKMHHGQIWVKSKIGEGTTVIIKLPVRLPGGQMKETDSGALLLS